VSVVYCSICDKPVNVSYAGLPELPENYTGAPVEVKADCGHFYDLVTQLSRPEPSGNDDPNARTAI
jgi:hypothetical protein